jgi:MSHA pilin protein MshA
MKIYSLKNEIGFTLIELIIVIIIISILAITALPKLINLSSGAQANVTTSIAGALSSANAENYASRIINPANGSPVTNCKSVANLLQSGLPSGYKITSRSVKNNASVNCTLRGPSSTTASFLATGIH